MMPWLPWVPYPQSMWVIRVHPMAVAVPPASERASEACAASSLSDNRKSVVCGAHLHSICVCVLFVLQFRASIFCLFITLYGTVSRVGKRSFFCPPFFSFFLVFQRHFE